MKGTKQDEEEFEMLLGEIPRATSAPPHLEELHRVNNKSPKGEKSGSCSTNACKSSIPETYEDFYQDYQEVKNMSQSHAGSKIASHSHTPNNPLKSFYSNLPMDSCGRVDSPQLQEVQRSPSQAILRQQNKMEQVEELSTLTMHHNRVALPAQQFFPDHQSLASAFANLNFEKNNVIEQAIQEPVGNGGGFGNGLVDDGQGPSQSGVAYSGLNVTGMPVSEPFTHTLNSPGSKATVPASVGIHGIKYPIHFANNNGNAGEIDMLLKHNTYGAVASGNSSVGSFYDASGVLLDPDCRRQFPLYSSGGPPVRPYQVLPSSTSSGTEVGSSVLGLQQQYFSDPHFGSYLQPPCSPVSALQQMNPMYLTWQQIEDERRNRMHQQYILLQQAQALSGLPNPVLSTIAGNGSNLGLRPQGPMTNFQQLEQPHGIHQSGTATAEGDCAGPIPGMTGTLTHNYPEFPLQSGNISRYNSHCFCGSGESCPFSNCQMQPVASTRMSQPGSLSLKDPRMVAILDQQEKPNFPERILTRNGSRGVNSVTTINSSSPGGRKKDLLSNGHGSARPYLNGQYPSSSFSGPFQLDNRANSKGVPSRITEHELSSNVLPNPQQQQAKYSSLEEVEGRIYLIAKDQHGCRFLQKKFEEGSLEDVQKIFVEIIDHIIELMTDPFGNYLVQKLLEVCTEEQKMQILLAVTRKPGELVNISLNMHGTRAVQKLIETLKTPEQISLVIAALEPGVVTLIKDLNGNHVVQRCLQRLTNEDNQFLFDAAAKHCVEIATHRHGCCVLQRCVDHSSGAQRDCLVAEIAANGFRLSQDPFGNYVVQYILDFDIPWATGKVITQLEGNYVFLSMQKFGSNVVEKCLKLCKEEHRVTIVKELLSSSRLGQLLQDPYGNYVVQSALAVSKGAIHAALVEAIRPHVPALRSSPFGKRILSRTNLKK